LTREAFGLICESSDTDAYYKHLTFSSQSHCHGSAGHSADQHQFAHL